MRLKFSILASFATVIVLVSCGDASRIAQEARRNDARIEAVLSEIAFSELDASPETATRLGLSTTDTGYDHLRVMDDRSQAAFERQRLSRIEALARLETLPAASQRWRQSLALVLSTYEDMVDLHAFGRGVVSHAYARPYPIDQFNGAYLEGPEILLRHHPLRRTEDAEAYLHRLADLARAITDDAERLRIEAVGSHVPPRHVLDLIRQQIAGQILVAPAQHALVVEFTDRLRAHQAFTQDVRRAAQTQAERLVREEVYPAYLTLLSVVDSLYPNAPDVPGLWAQTDGRAYYAALLALYTQSDLGTDRLFQTGEQAVDELTDELMRALNEIGLETGSLAERMAALSALEGQLVADTEQGRETLLAEIEADISLARRFTPDMVRRPPRADVSVAQAPAARQSTAPGGYYEPASAERSWPGVFYINLRDVNEWPRYSIPTLVFHETLPGHHLESAIVAERASLPLIRRLVWLPSYGEGWALYAEDLADEFGFYDDRPLARIGYLQSLLFRAARLVADIGLHDRRWSRQQAIDYLVETTGQPASAMATEVDRYIVWPGQAASYLTGRNAIHRLRNRAEQVLGNRFDLRDFHSLILEGGARPWSMVEEDVDEWIADRL